MHSGQTGQAEVKGSMLNVVAAKLKSIEDRDQRPINNSGVCGVSCRPVSDEEYVLTYSQLEQCSLDQSREVGIQKKHFREVAELYEITCCGTGKP